jgi:hypothetical protein
MCNVPMSPGCLWFGAIALNPGNEAPSFSIANVNIADASGIQKPLDASLDFILRRAFARDDPPALAISFQGERKGTQLLREYLSFSKSRARPGMNKDWTRRRVVMEALKWVKGEENSIFLANPELF